MKALIFDTETNHKIPSQADLVQLAAVLEDVETTKPYGRIDILVETEGWDIPEGAFKVHGITKERADTYGILLANACWLFRNLVEQADVVVAHNLDYDRQVMIRALAAANVTPIPWADIKQRCTMKTATPICRIPSPRGGFKWPTLTECLKHFTGKEVINAHDAMADTQACRTIHRYLHQMGAFG
jgi:DNA polymerase III subunit epsilon